MILNSDANGHVCTGLVCQICRPVSLGVRLMQGPEFKPHYRLHIRVAATGRPSWKIGMVVNGDYKMLTNWHPTAQSAIRTIAAAMRRY